MTLKKLLLASLASLACMWGTALAQQHEVDAVHRQAVAEMLDAIKVLEVVHGHLDRAAAEPGHHRELFQYMRPRTTRDDVLAAYVPVYAPLLSTAAARQIALAYTSPAGRKSLAYELERASKGSRAVKRSSKEYQAIHQFNSGAAARQLAALYERGGKEASAAFGAWVFKQQEELFQGAIAEMERQQASVEVKGQQPPAPFVPVPVGISYVDEWVALIGRTNTRRTLAEWRVKQDLDALGYKTLLTPESLAAPAVVAANLATLDKIDAHNEAYLLEMELALKEFADSAVQIETRRGQTGTRVHQDVKDQQDTLVRYTRGSRASLGTTRRILVFAQARKGKLGVKDGSLQLSTKDDLAIYNAYVEQLNHEQQEIDDLLARKARRRTNWL